MAVLFVPGGLIAASLGLRGLTFLAVTPALSVFVVAGTAIVLPYLGISWSLMPVIVAAVVFAAVLFAASYLTPDKLSLRFGLNLKRPTATAYAAIIGFLVGSISIAFQLRQAFDRPDNISQTFDNVFHLNAVRYILDTANGSSLTLTSMTNGDNPPYFYPAAWHDLASLVVQITDAPISVTANVLNICIAAVAWPLGCMFLTKVVTKGNGYAVGAAGLLAAGFSAFPLLLLDFGVLYPNFLALSMLPAALAGVAVFFNAGNVTGIPCLARFVLAPSLAAGLAIAHPNGLMSLVALSAPILLFSYGRYWVRKHKQGEGYRGVALFGIALLLAFAIMAVMWKLIRPPVEASGWPTVQTVGQAVGEVVTNSPMRHSPAWAVSALMLLGIVVVARRRHNLWFLGSFLVTAVLFVVVSAGPDQWFRNQLTGVWYNDSYRLAALLPIVAVPLAAVGLGWLIGQSRLWWISGRRTGRRWFVTQNRARATGVVVLPLVLFGAALALQMPPIGGEIASAHKIYATTPNAPLVSKDEMALLEELDNYVPQNATIAANPWNGSAMAFALADRNTTSKHTLTTYTPAVLVLNDHLRDAAGDPEVCKAVHATGVGYALNFGTQEVHGENHGFKGLLIENGTPGFQLLAQVGEAKLFKVTACG
ncbi:DUF6541 family protein [Arthrobacter bambusae]|uniref:DUF6541 family protein n=1 Tax=Arthrobacter bambusae TaxID=1338426 RepID=UPI002784EE2D|nr:DUF6541 family protein [Arthrobacter bambusae]MDQ0030197.1 hypothetical protein [Arthrobacter bambusae]MDQ0097879.1 hypothetical protein [Arthrobacter bambusae]